MSQTLTADGVHSLLPRNLMTESARRRRDAYAITPGAPFQKLEFGFYCIDEWRQQGLPANANFDQLFSYDPPGNYSLGGLGWCEAAMVPAFEVKLIEQRGDTEIEQDFAGRHVLYFKGRRNGFMPEYVDHPVKDLATWRNNIKWRLNPQDPARFVDLDSQMARAKEAAANGLMITQGLVGSFMYLRSMIGPEELLYAFHDQPELIDECMKTWYELADAVIARHQQHVTLDEIFFAEDNCYNHGPLVDPAMLRSMLIPYYQQLIRNVKARQIDKARHLHVQIDTDGDCRPLIQFYIDTIGMDAMSPFEVASGCDVVEIGRQYPHLCIRGGIDKRVLASGRKAIDEMLNRILPTMRRRGGYIPCCDHGVPAEVPYADYLYYRQRCVELGE